MDSNTQWINSGRFHKVPTNSPNPNPVGKKWILLKSTHQFAQKNTQQASIGHFQKVPINSPSSYPAGKWQALSKSTTRFCTGHFLKTTKTYVMGGHHPEFLPQPVHSLFMENNTPLLQPWVLMDMSQLMSWMILLILLNFLIFLCYIFPGLFPLFMVKSQAPVQHQR